MDLGLKGKTALVCGSSQGIGRAVAEALAAEGAAVAVNSRSTDKVRAVAKETSRTPPPWSPWWPRRAPPWDGSTSW
jgi:3-oxoacyl-[acyl-carrier protein] reductase